MRVLVCPLASNGFLFPALGLARALGARGHEVAVLTAASAGPWLEEAGLAPPPGVQGDGRGFATEHWFQPLAVALQVRQIEQAMAHFAPDLLVGQALTLGPLIVRERAGIPVAVQGLAAHLWPGGGARWSASAATLERRRWRHADMLRHLDNARALARLPALPALPALSSPGRDPDRSPLLGDLFLLRSIAELHGGPGIPGCLHLVGACLWEPARADAELHSWLAEARRRRRPVAYVQPGRTFGGPGFWRQLAELCARGSLAAVVAAGRGDPGAAGCAGAGRIDEPLSCDLLARHDPCLGAVLPHADLAIGSASSTLVLGALTHGIPSLLLPSGGEQPDLAEQVERAGAAMVVPPEALTVGALHEAVSAVLGDEALRRRARALGRSFARLDGLVVSARLLEGLAVRSGGAHTAVSAWPASREPA